MKTGTRPRNGVAVQEIWTLFQDDLARVEQWIRTTLSGESADIRSTVPYVAEVTQHLFSSGGKRVRPLLLLLSSSLCGEESDERRILLASVVEFIHTATLLHDDVIDDAPIRRGRKSPRMIWGNQASILVGDYLYTKALSLALSLKNHEINETLADVTRQMTEGELLQLFRNGDPEISEEDYLEIIRCKTAALMSAACRLGAIVGEAAEEKKEALGRYGRYIGAAFQLTDDTLDYAADRDRLGKSLGNDLQEGKITLPLLHLLRTCKDGDLRRVREIIASERRTEKDLAFIQELLRRNRSLDYALSLAREYAAKARETLAPFEEPAPSYQALIDLADFVVERDL